MRSFRLENNLLTGTIPTEIGAFQNRRILLYISHNRITGTLPFQLFNGPILQNFKANNCLLTGTIPTEIGRSANLKELTLENNQLRGQIPSEFGVLAELTDLSMQGNDLTGTMPIEVCGLRAETKGLRVLDVDCGPTNVTGPPKIDCNLGCCTSCCDSVTGFCLRESEP